jgi:hypothetical protein
MIEIAGAENRAGVSRRIKVIETTTAQCKRLLKKIERRRYRMQIAGNSVPQHAVTCLGISAAIDPMR